MQVPDLQNNKEKEGSERKEAVDLTKISNSQYPSFLVCLLSTDILS